MLSGIKLDLVEKFNFLNQIAHYGRDNFPDELCNFLVTEFELQACVLFKVDDTSKLIVLGKSNSARKNFLRGSSFDCASCKLKTASADFSIHSDSNCTLQISEFVVYESCVSFKINNGERGFLKIAKKTPFSQSDSEGIKNLTTLISQLILIWAESSSSEKIPGELGFNEITSKISMELRAPANSIIGFTSILSEDNLTSSQSEYVNTIKNNAHQILLTINDLSDLAKLDSGLIQVSMKATKLTNLIKELTSIIKQKSANKSLQFTYEFSDEFEREQSIDDQKVRLIINYLLQFLTSFRSANIIEISGKTQNEKSRLLSIKGKDIILSEVAERKLFVPFGINEIEELKNSSVPGLGLLLAKKYAELLGGSLIASRSKEGLEFKLLLSTGEHKSASGLISQLPKSTSELNKILVIEDDYATSKLMSNYLTKWGYEPVIVNTKEQTLKLIQKEKFLAIILDIEIPNTNGLELLKQINANPLSKSTPVIVCSIEADQQKAYLMGAVEYFVKPINYNYLVEILTSYKLRKNSNILCVDDDVPTLNLIKQAIETAGYNAVAEHISANVMDEIKDKIIDLAIIDLDMPHPNGFELIAQLKSEDKFKNLPIIIYTGKENYADDLKKIDGLFDQLLDKKSTNIEDLASTIEAMVNRADLPPAEEVIKKIDGVKILLAEDYKHSQIIVTRLLKKNNFENIVVVENGEEAYSLAKKDKFDLILMDMQMPVMNGFEATEQIRQIPEYKDTPIIALTAFAMKGDREKCLDAGATDYIPKPIDSKEFIEKVKYYTNS